MSQSERTPSRRGLLAHGTAALLTGAAIVTTAHGAPVVSPAAAGDDAELIRLCAEFDENEQREEAIYEAEPDDDLAAAAVAGIVERQAALAERIKGMRVHSADGILAITRSVAVCNGDGTFDFDPKGGGIMGGLMTALMREVCLLSGLPAPSMLEGRATA